jgi:septal ring-binding cell division protein DamX
VSKPFFLTRQTANLMEDFTRELKVGASLFLLYGDNGAGKTRLLRELSEKRLSSGKIHWIDLNAENPDEKNQQLGSAEVEAFFDAADSGDIIIVDHFESALKKTRHQLFLSWSTEGVDKKLSMIIASSSEGFNEFRQLSQHYQVNVQSFELMPFNPDEVEAFLGFYLFPDHPIGKLSIPSDLCKQLAATDGAVGPVIKIAERDGAQIGSSPMTDTESIRKGSRIMVTILIIFAITAGVGWYFLSSQSTPVEAAPAVAREAQPVATFEPVVEAEVQKEPDVEPGVETVAELEPETSSLTQTELEDEPEIAVAEPEPVTPSLTEAELEVEPESVVAEPEPAVSAAVETTPETETMPDVAPDTQIQIGPEPGTASDTDAVLVEEANQEDAGDTALASAEISSNQSDQAELSDMDRFQQDLRFSMDWIKTKEDSAGTIQILLLSFSSFDPAAYYEYLQHLANQQVDVDNIRVFKTLTGGTEVYSVVYGEYASRKAAGGSLDGLPEALRNISPIRRSVGGLREEIRRLGAVN